MATQAEAKAAKSEVRRLLRNLGVVVVSIGIEATRGGVRLAVGVASDFSSLPSADFEFKSVPVHVFEQRYGQIA